MDGVLAGGERFHFVFPPIAREGEVWASFRVPPRTTRSKWAQDPGFATALELALGHSNLLVSGATGTGKTTLIRELLAQLPPQQRVVVLEDTPEIGRTSGQLVHLVARPKNADGFGEISVRELLRQTLRMRPDRIVLGECRGREVLDLVQALNTGHGGLLSSVHANSARQALHRVGLLARLHPDARNLEPKFLAELIGTALHAVVHLDRTSGQKRIREIQQITGVEDGVCLMTPLYLADSEAPVGFAGTASKRGFASMSEKKFGFGFQGVP